MHSVMIYFFLIFFGKIERPAVRPRAGAPARATRTHFQTNFVQKGILFFPKSTIKEHTLFN